MLKRIRLLTNLGWVNHIVMTHVARGTGMGRDISDTLQMKIKQASLLAKIIVTIHGAGGIGTERDMKHTSRELIQKTRLLKSSLLLLKEIHIHTVMTQDVRQTGTERVVVLGLIFVPLAIVGAMWKKSHIHTIIRFRDDDDDQKIIVDFDKNLESALSTIYKRMLEFRKARKLFQNLEL